MATKIFRPITQACAVLAAVVVAATSARAIDVANYYSTSTLDATSNATVNVARNFAATWNGPMIGSAMFTLDGGYVSATSSQLSLINNTGNTFSGNITVNRGTLRIAGNAYDGTQGFIAPSMTANSTIFLRPGGTLNIDDNVNGTAGYVADRFGSSGNRPAVALTGGALALNGLNNASSSVQTLGTLSALSGSSAVSSTRNSAGNPTLTFGSLAISQGAVVSFHGTNLGTGTNDARITFGTAPTLTNGILAGAKIWVPGTAGQGEFATYNGTNGVTTFTAYDLVSGNITGATSTQNVAITIATTPDTLSANTSVNSLNYRGNGGTWSLGGNTLTLTSGMFLRNGTNAALTIDTGMLTAGNGSDDIDLHILTAQQNVTINAVVADNSASAVTLVKSHGNTLTLSGGANNTYTGGTYVVDGTLTTGTTANRTYLGTGKVTVDNATLSLGGIGATSNASGDDYTAINGGQINIASGAAGAYTVNDTFNIGAGGVISGGSASGQGLASLSRGTNITIGSNAVVAHGALTAALNLTTGTIQNLGTSADVYYGLNVNQNSASGSINIGTGTAFKGLSTDRSARAWQQGTINIASGTTSVDFQGFSPASAAPLVLTLGNGGTAGAPVINFAGSGTVDIRALGSLTLNDSTATYGNTGASQNVRFVSTLGSTLTVTTATGMGSGTGIASALIQDGGILAIGAADALNGAVTVEAGGQFTASIAGGLTGSGALTFNEGSSINITNATGFSGSQATAASVAAGTIVRLNANSIGTATDTLDSYLVGDSPIYQVFGNSRGLAEPTSPGTTIMTLNKNGSGVGGILTNDLANRALNVSTNGVVTLGANGGVVAATSGTTMTVSTAVTGSGSLTAGTTAIIEGAPKLGTVVLGNALNSYSGGTIVNAGRLQLLQVTSLGSTTGSLTVNAGGTLDLNTHSPTVGNLSGTGGTITGISSSRTLTIGNGDFGGGNFQGSIINGGGTTALTKNGTGTITLSGNNTYTGATTINAGTLRVNGSLGATAVTVASPGTLGGNGTLAGALTVSGSLAPGNSIGTLTTTNDVTWNGSLSTPWVFELGAGNTSDFLNITGGSSDFLRGTGTSFVFDFADSTATGNFTLVAWGGTSNFTIGNFTYTNLGGGNTGNFSISGNSLQFVVVPEPAALALVACGLAGLGVVARRRFGRPLVK